MDADVRSQLLEEASEYLKAEEDDVVFNLAFARTILLQLQLENYSEDEDD